MSSDRWQQVDRLLEAALEVEPERRAAFLDEACGGDEALRREVESLLAAGDRAGDFLASPAVDVAARLEAGPEEAHFATTLGLPGDGAAPAWADPSHSGDPLVGAVLGGKYRLEALLGRGGMGAVYRATQLQLDREVAVKVMRGDMLSDPSAVARFQREARAVARLRHPHIVAVHDFGVEPATGAYLVMEHLEGRSLRNELRARAPLPPVEAVRLIGEILAAVREAHARGVVHRDLKPENVLLERTSGAPRAKVLDFGLAKLQEPIGSQQSTITRSGEVLGTPLYMSPEQYLGEEADERSDVYALGCVLFEMLAGRPPFVAKAIGALVYKHLGELPAPPGRIVPGVPAALDRIVLRALAKEPGERFQTADDFARALEDWNAPASGGAGPPPPRPAGRTPNNLPREATHFVGRFEQLAEVERALETSRLVTLTGPGGTGKTRLALKAAEGSLDAFPDGVWLVDLAPITDPDLVLPAVARTLGVKQDASAPIVGTIARVIGDRRMLVVLDNFEQVLDAAPLVAELLAAAPRLTLLVTSRAPLRVRAERELAVPPLEVPTPRPMSRDALAGYEAVALFAERARAVEPDFELTDASAAAVAEICRRLDGLPLAIELAVARLRLLDPEAILARLENRLELLTGGARDLPERQRTMRAAIAWSYELLDEDEQALLRRLAAFVGGFTIEAAEAVCGVPGGPDLDVVDGLASLLEKSLLKRERWALTEARFGMLETIREYALEQLDESGERPDVERRHAAYFLALGEAAEVEMFGARASERLDRLEAEHDNIRAALRWLHDADAEGCLRLAVAVRNLWMMHGHFPEGRRWLGAALERAGDAPPALLRTTALRAVGYLAKQQGDLTVAREFMEASVRVARETNDPLQIAHSGRGLGAVAKNQGDLPAARACLEESLEIGRRLGRDDVVANALRSLGELARLDREWAAACELYDEALALSRRIGDRGGVSMSLVNLGLVAWETGDAEAARVNYREALEIQRELGSKSEMSVTLDGLAAVAARDGAWRRAARLAGAAEALREAIGYDLEPVDRGVREGCLAELRERLGAEGLEAATAEGRALSLDEALDEALGHGTGSGSDRVDPKR